MFKQGLVLLILYFALAHGKSVVEPQKFSKQVNFTGINSVTVPFGNRLYTLSKNETHLLVNLSDKNFEKWSKRCVIALDPENDIIVGKIHKIVLDSSVESVVAIWGVRTSEIVEASRKTNYTFLLVKPLPCTYQALILPIDETPADDLPQLPIVNQQGLGYHIFYYGKKCSPCFISNWYQFSPPQQLAIENVKPSKPFLLTKTRLLDGQIGYFYAYNFENGTAVVKLLTLNYEIVQKIYVDHLIDVADCDYSTRDEETYISFCYGNGTQQVFCGQFDDDLQLRFLQGVTLLPQYFASSLSIKVDNTGRSLVGIIQSSLDKENEPHKVSIHTFDKTGEAIKSIDIGEIEPKYKYNELINWFFYRKDKHYCAYIIEMEKIDDTNTNEVIKCIDYDPFENTSENTVEAL